MRQVCRQIHYTCGPDVHSPIYHGLVWLHVLGEVVDNLKMSKNLQHILQAFVEHFPPTCFILRDLTVNNTTEESTSNNKSNPPTSKP